MKSALTLTALLCAAGLGGSACAHHHRLPVYYRYVRADYYHGHRLDCGCQVECHYYGGAHHYRKHVHRSAYWHQHYVGSGYYAACHVVGGRHHLRRY